MESTLTMREVTPEASQSVTVNADLRAVIDAAVNEKVTSLQRRLREQEETVARNHDEVMDLFELKERQGEKKLEDVLAALAAEGSRRDRQAAEDRGRHDRQMADNQRVLMSIVTTMAAGRGSAKPSEPARRVGREAQEGEALRAGKTLPAGEVRQAALTLARPSPEVTNRVPPPTCTAWRRSGSSPEGAAFKCADGCWGLPSSHD